MTGLPIEDIEQIIEICRATETEINGFGSLVSSEFEYETSTGLTYRVLYRRGDGWTLTADTTTQEH